MSNQEFIGFPPNSLSSNPLRVPVIDEAKSWIAINKPAGVAIRQHPWNSDISNMDTALNLQLRAQKPELVKRGATLFGSVFSMEPEISGVALFAKHRTSLAELRNLIGSDRFQFRFLLVTQSILEEECNEMCSNAPLLTHNTKPKMIPSTAKGKKAQTHFTCIRKSILGWALWEAKTTFPRFHQIRAHAALEGIPVLGDSLYSGPDIPPLSKFISSKQPARIRQPIFSGIALHLSEVILPLPDDDTEQTRLTADLPKYFKLLLTRLKLD